MKRKDLRIQHSEQRHIKIAYHKRLCPSPRFVLPFLFAHHAQGGVIVYRPSASAAETNGRFSGL